MQLVIKISVCVTGAHLLYLRGKRSHDASTKGGQGISSLLAVSVSYLLSPGGCSTVNSYAGIRNFSVRVYSAPVFCNKLLQCNACLSILLTPKPVYSFLASWGRTSFGKDISAFKLDLCLGFQRVAEEGKRESAAGSGGQGKSSK